MIDIESLGTTGIVLIVVIFILFVVSLKKAIGILKNAAFVAVAAILFPIIANLIGLPIAADTESIIFFLALGLVLYVVYLIAISVYTLLGFAEKKVQKSPVVKYVKKNKKEQDDEED